MEEKDLHKEESQKIVFPWKSFFKDQLFLMIVGIVACIAYLIIFFLKKDNVYMILSIVIPCIILVWIGLEALFMFFKEKQKIKLAHKEG